MNRQKVRVSLAASFSFLVACVITMFPLPSNFWWLRPHWLTLVLIYWVMFPINVIGVISGFILGLLLDLLTGSSLGSTGLVLAFIAFLTIMLRSRLKQCNFWQKTMIIIFLLSIEQLSYWCLQLACGNSSVDTRYWSTTISSIIVWPIILLLLQSYQRKLKLL